MLSARELLSSCKGPWVLRSDELRTFYNLEGIIILDGGRMIRLNDFYDEVAEKFKFPEYFGRNFNALSEMLSDLSWLNNGIYIVLIKNANKVLAHEKPEALDGLLELLSDVGKEWSEPIAQGQKWDRPCVPFHSILQVDPYEKPAGLRKLPVA